MKTIKISIITSIISLAFSGLLFAFGFLYFAGFSRGWFSTNTTVDANGFALQVEEDSSITTISTYAFRYDGMYGAICVDVQNNSELTMSEYDVIFTDKNVNTPLFFRVVARGIPNSQNGSITVTIPCTTTLYSENSTIIEQGDSSIVQKVLSNIVTCKIGYGLVLNGSRTVDNYIPVATTTSRNENNVSIFTGVRDLMRKEVMDTYNVESAKFINNESFDEDDNILSAEKTTTSISLTIDYDDYKDYLCAVNVDSETGQIVSYDYDAAEKDCLVFYVEFDYDDNLVNIYRQHSNDSGFVEFVNDFGIITIKENRG